MKALLLSLFIITLTFSGWAQQYERSAGIRLGNSNGIFFDKQNDDLSTYRFMMSWRENGQHFTAMKIFNLYKLDYLPDEFSIYYGYGVHAGFISFYEQTIDKKYGYYVEKKTAPVIGLDALVGISYNLQKLPVSITWDAKPYIDAWGRNAFKLTSFDVALGAIYHF